MPKKILITLMVFAIMAVGMFGIGRAADPSVALPQAITAESPCPATGCASGECHGYEAVPDPDGIHEMTCPEANCSSTECHAWDSLTGRYKHASDASLNLWVLFPALLVTALSVFVKRAR